MEVVLPQGKLILSRQAETTLVLVAGGRGPDPSWLTEAVRDMPVYAADRGSDYCIRAGLWPVYACGDRDSGRSSSWEQLKAHGCRIRTYLVNKADTDLSLLLKPDGKGKLSKRDGDKLGFPVFPLRWVNPEGEVSRGYREDGYFPEAFVNLLAFLGWNPGDDREILSMDELVQAFSLDRIVRSGARFSVEKAHWYNREYLRMKSTEELTGLFIPILEQNGIHREKDYVAAVVALTRERVTFVADFWTVAKCLFVAPDTYDEKDAAKFWTAENAPLVSAAASWLCKDYSGPWTKEGIEEALVEHIRSQEWPMGKVMNALRLALTGAASGLGIADLAALLGPDEVAARVASAEKALMK